MFLTITYYFTKRRVSNVQFPYAFCLLGAGTEVAFFLRLKLRLLVYFGAAPSSAPGLFSQPAPRIQKHPAPATAPQPWGTPTKKFNLSDQSLKVKLFISNEIKHFKEIHFDFKKKNSEKE